MCWEPGSCKTGCLWHMVSPEIVVKMTTGAVIPSESLTGGGFPFTLCFSWSQYFLGYFWVTLVPLTSVQFSALQSLSCVWLFATPWTAAYQASLPITNSQSLLKTHVHQLGDAIQLSHLLLSPSPAFSLSQHWGLFKWVSSSHQVAKVLEFQLQHQSFQWIFRTDFL